MPTPQQLAARRQAFRELHASGCFLIVNPWDRGSAMYLQALGFKALATSSAASAWRDGLPDGAKTLEETLEDLRQMVGYTELPVNADFEAGYADDAAGVKRNVRLAIDTGIAGLSIEDATGVADAPLRELGAAVERIRAARAAIDESGSGVLLVGRAENFFVGRPDLDDTIRRLQAYAEAGADCLYAPGIQTREQVAAVVAAVRPKPVNLMLGSQPVLSLAEIAELGVRRVSVGGALMRVAWGAFMRAAGLIAQKGSWDGLAGAVSAAELNAFFRDPAKLPPRS